LIIKDIKTYLASKNNVPIHVIVYEYNTSLLLNSSTCGNGTSEKLMPIALKGLVAKNMAKLKGEGAVPPGNWARDRY
jgi:hypothetical protein